MATIYPKNRIRADYPLSGSAALTLAYKPNNVCNAEGKNKLSTSAGQAVIRLCPKWESREPDTPVGHAQRINYK